MSADPGYQLQRATNRIAVLEQMLTIAQKGDELRESVARIFSLSLVGKDVLRIGAKGLGGLCNSAQNATLVFSVALAWGQQAPMGAFLTSACPKTDMPTDVRLPPSWNDAAATALLHRHGAMRAPSKKLCVTLEFFNVPRAVIASSRPGACTRFALPVAAPVGCVNTAAPFPPEALPAPPSAQRRAQWWPFRRSSPPPQPPPPPSPPWPADMPLCSHQESALPGLWVRRATELVLTDELDPRHGYYAPSGCRTREQGVRSPIAQLQWLHVVGDSVTYNLFPSFKRAFASAVGEEVGWGLRDRPRGMPQWICECTIDRRRCVTMSAWYDKGGAGKARPSEPLRLPALPAREEMPFQQCTANVSAARPDVTIVSLGSHSNWGADAEAHKRYVKGFTRWLKSQQAPRTAGIVLALQTARGIRGIPPKFGGIDTICTATNMRIQLNNDAQATSLRHVCERLGRADSYRVLDLFSPTLPWAASGSVFKMGDPIHFRGLGVFWAKHLVVDVLRSLFEPA